MTVLHPAVVGALVLLQACVLVHASGGVYEEGKDSYVSRMQTATACANKFEVDVQKCSSATLNGNSMCASATGATMLSDSTFASLSCCNNTVGNAGACPIDTLPTTTATFASLIAEKEAFIRDLESQARSSIEGRCFSLASCNLDCSYKSCSSDIGSPTCTKRFGGLPAQCPTTSSSPTNCDGRKLNFDKTTVLLASETRNEASAADEFICGTRNLDPWFKARHTSDLLWTYFGDIYGQYRIYPGYARERDSTGCKAYDPRIRPWYLAASSGPKDVVIVLDVSGSMNQYTMSGKSRLQIIKDTLNGHDGKAGLLDTFSFTDYISIVLFNGESSVQTIDPGQSDSFLIRATSDNIAKAKLAVSRVVANGQTNFRAGFGKAFEILSNSAANEGYTSSCSSVILFLTDGRDQTCESCSGDYQDAYGACKCTDKIVEYIDMAQDKLVAKGGKRATIFTYSMGEGADDAVPRSIACANGGAWGSISDGEDPLSKMMSYYKYMARSNINSDGVFWTEPYDDDPTGLKVTTAAKVVYESSGGKHMLGVVGVDVPLQSLDQNFGTHYQSLLGSLMMRSRACFYSTPDACEMQMLRQEGSCAPDLPKDRCCYRQSSSTKTFVKVSYAESYHDAAQYCEQFPDGQLAVPSSASEYEFLSGIAPRDGAWVGLTQQDGSAEPSGGWQWIDRSSAGHPWQPMMNGMVNIWGSGQPNNFGGAENCGVMDSRGSRNNIKDENCNERFPFICQFRSSNDTDVRCSDCTSFGAGVEKEDGKEAEGDILGLMAVIIPAVGAVFLGGGLYYKTKRSTQLNVACCSSVGGNMSARSQQNDMASKEQEDNKKQARRQVDPAPASPGQPQYQPQHGLPQTVNYHASAPPAVQVPMAQYNTGMVQSPAYQQPQYPSQYPTMN
ncbi:voltage-dependent calcium channel subunit [Chloropicon primus]|uniref:C-type lectin domain-containing protein n=3 Tax=Chloropicon primus TaxID=1764295 RepID=A0A5B8MHP3_9CHLO|nr:hypothetical protein A3770_02p14080 [Chloropicon primus]UPQ98098.1 voltage-dependent calcium channel subunit [Chloropicon primus]|eukprot:QDZ18890.1 hypothetical protein A3770_02p14080 [Chloropicon primus]